MEVLTGPSWQTVDSTPEIVLSRGLVRAGVGRLLGLYPEVFRRFALHWVHQPIGPEAENPPFRKSIEVHPLQAPRGPGPRREGGRQEERLEARGSDKENDEGGETLALQSIRSRWETRCLIASRGLLILFLPSPLGNPLEAGGSYGGRNWGGRKNLTTPSPKGGVIPIRNPSDCVERAPRFWLMRQEV